MERSLAESRAQGKRARKPGLARGGALRARRRGPDWNGRAALTPGIDDVDDADEIDDPRTEGVKRSGDEP